MNDRDYWKRLFQQGQNCPSIERLGDYLSSLSDEKERIRVASHIRSCSKCSSELTLLRNFNEGEVRPAEQNDVARIVNRLEEKAPVIWQGVEAKSKSRSKSSFWRDLLSFKLVPVLATAMAGFLAVMVASLLLTTAPEIAPIPDNGTPILRSGTIRIESPRGDLDQLPQEFKWLVFEKAVNYEVRVSEVDRTEILTLTTASSSAKIPDKIRDQLAAGKPVYWQVSAVNSSGKQIAQSELTRIAFSKNE